MLNIYSRSALALACVIAAACGEPSSGTEPSIIPPPPPPPLCDGESNTERAPLQRLTAVQFLHTLEDLVGEPVHLPVDIPGDDKPLGFYNGASSAGLAHASAYHHAAEWAAPLLAARGAVELRDLTECARGFDASCKRAVIAELGLPIYRRPLTEAEVGEYVMLADAADEGSPAQRLTLVLGAMLQSPAFLHRTELGVLDADVEVSLLDGYGLASRLSYFLWNSMPDEELFAAAAAGELSTVEQVEAQARRMLDDPRCDDMLDDFIVQWLDLETLNQTVKSPRHFPAFDGSLRAAAEEETKRFFRHVFRSGADATLESLLTADYSVLNEELANFYGVEGVSGEEFVVADLPAERSGLLTQVSFLAVNAHPTETSPVLRGRFVRERLFCQPLVPPDNPDDDVDLELPAHVPGQTMRERLSAHQDVAATCFGCHSLMDNIGFGFEAFDGSGAFRMLEEGEPIDTTGEIVGAESVLFDGPIELAEALHQDPLVQTCFATQWFHFAHRRSQTEKDACSLESAMNSFAESGFNIRELMVAITTTDSFRYVRSATQGGV